MSKLMRLAGFLAIISGGIFWQCYGIPAQEKEEDITKEMEKKVPSLDKTMGSVWYTILAGNKKMGFAHLTVKEGKYNDKDVLILESEMTSINEGEAKKIKSSVYSKKDAYLSPLYTKTEIPLREGISTMETEFKNGKAYTITETGDKRENEIPKDTITVTALMRVVTLIPFTKGASLNFFLIGEPELMPVQRQVKYVGKEETKINDKKDYLHKLTVDDSTFWVNEERVLIKAESSGGQMIISTEKEAEK